jgi:hypothetical protein
VRLVAHDGERTGEPSRRSASAPRSPASEPPTITIRSGEDTLIAAPHRPRWPAPDRQPPLAGPAPAARHRAAIVQQRLLAINPKRLRGQERALRVPLTHGKIHDDFHLALPVRPQPQPDRYQACPESARREAANPPSTTGYVRAPGRATAGKQPDRPGRASTRPHGQTVSHASSIVRSDARPGRYPWTFEHLVGLSSACR